MALTLATGAFVLAIGLFVVSFVQWKRGRDITVVVQYVQAIWLLGFVPILLIATLLDYLKIDPLPGWCG